MLGVMKWYDVENFGEKTKWNKIFIDKLEKKNL
jgi:hypothetical protein